MKSEGGMLYFLFRGTFFYFSKDFRQNSGCFSYVKPYLHQALPVSSVPASGNSTLYWATIMPARRLSRLYGTLVLLVLTHHMDHWVLDRTSSSQWCQQFEGSSLLLQLFLPSATVKETRGLPFGQNIFSITQLQVVVFCGSLWEACSEKNNSFTHLGLWEASVCLFASDCHLHHNCPHALTFIIALLACCLLRRTLPSN